MKSQKLLLLLIGIFFYTGLNAAYLRDVPQVITQPDGTIIHCFATGDEFYNWLHDENHFTIIQNHDNGYYYYAQLDGDLLVPSIYLVGRDKPEDSDLKPGINISPEQMRSIRSAIESQEPDRPVRSNREVAEVNQGIMNNLVIYIRFSDQSEFSADTTTNWNMFNNPDSGYNSMYNYFKEVSYEKLFLTSTFYPGPASNTIISYQDAHPRSYYMPYEATTNPGGYQGNQRTTREHALLVNAVNYVNQNSPVPPELDIDFNDDGFVDNVVFIIKGSPTAWATLLWPHRWSLFSQSVLINGAQVWDYNFQLETSLNGSGNGVLCHEMFHSLGSPDLYHYTSNGISPVGPWDIMEQDNNPPQYMGAYMKYKYGNWIDNIPEITTTGTYTLFPLQDSVNNAFKIASWYSDTEFFVVEYRKQEGTFDGNLPGSGILIYRIDPSAGNGNASGPPDEVYLFRPGGEYGTSGMITLANYSLEEGRTAINTFTDPAPFLQYGDEGGLSISQISQTGDSMTFFVEFPGPITPDFSSDVTVDCPGGVVTFHDNSVGIPTIWKWSFSPENVTFVNGTNSRSRIPQVIFDDYGYYSVTLVVSNDVDADTITKTDYINIGSMDLAFQEDFESVTFSDNSWKIENPDEELTWELSSASGNGSGAFAARVNFRDYFAVDERDRLITPPLNLQGVSNPVLYFEHAYAKYWAQATDSLVVYISTDCGGEWTRIYSGGDDGEGSFATHPLTQEVFQPDEASDWCLEGYGAQCNYISLQEWSGYDNVKIMFETASFYGNPIYIDNIDIDILEGIEESASGALPVRIYPNPSHGEVSIAIAESDLSILIEVFDLMGKTVYSELMLSGSSGSSNQLDLSELTKGVYFLVISDGMEKTAKKLILY